jgi:zinc transport system permease protein
MAHAALLGVALALAVGVPVALGTLAVALGMGLALSHLGARGWAMDAALGVAAQGALAVALVVASLTAARRGDLSAFLFGDILAVGRGEVALLWAGAAGVAALLAWRWSRLLTASVSPDLAQAAGIDPDRERLVLTLALAAIVALAIKVVGALLVAAMLVIPAAAARPLARSPEAMAVLATLAGMVAVVGGLGLSLAGDTPAGPSIVVAALVLFAVTGLRRHR